MIFKRLLLSGLAVAVASWAAEAAAATYRVGPGRTYTTLQAVAPLLQPGDLVEVDGGVTYPGDVEFTRAGTAANPIVIRGLRVNGARPVLSGGTNTVLFTTDWPYSGPGADHYVLEGFEIRGGSSRCVYHQADDLVIRDVVIHDCPAHGILGADEGSGSLRLEYSEVYRCGAGTNQHQIYMATDEVNHPGSVFRMQHNYVHDGLGGNNVKSRAERNEIYYNWIEGAFYHALELIGPDGGDGGNPALRREDSDVVGNVLVQRNGFYVTRVGGDGTGETRGRYRFVNNTILSGDSAVFRLFDGLESIEMHNNVFYRVGGGPVTVTRTADARWATGAAVMAGSRNWVPSGALAVPTQWTGTILGASPGFRDVATFDVRPAPGSPLLGAGTSQPASPPGFPFPTPLFPPAKQPPLHQIEPLGNAKGRPVLVAPAIGAYEATTFGVERDADGNGLGDLLSRAASGEVRPWLSNGAALQQAGPWTSGFVPYRYDVYYSDVDGDGRADLISRSRDNGNVEVFRSTGSSFVYAPGTGPGGVWSYGWGTSYDLFFADATGDGRADLVGRFASNGDVYVFPSTGSAFRSSAPGGRWSYGWSSGYDLFLADVTGDGRADLVSRHFGPAAGLTGNIYVGASTGGGFASPSLWTYGFSAGYDLYVADVSGDGRADLVARYYAANAGLSGNVYVLLSSGSGFTWSAGAGPWTYGWGSTYELLLRDVTGDGKADLLSRRADTGVVEVAKSTGASFSYNGTWASGLGSSLQVR